MKIFTLAEKSSKLQLMSSIQSSPVSQICIPSFLKEAKHALYRSELFAHPAALCSKSKAMLWMDNNQLVKCYLVTGNMRQALRELTALPLTYPFLCSSPYPQISKVFH